MIMLLYENRKRLQKSIERVVAVDKHLKISMEILATKIRIETTKEFKQRGFGHIGGALSVVDALAVLYGGVMNCDPQNPEDNNRDRLVMSKGHAGPALYATLALKGFFPLELLMTLNEPGTKLPSHCDRNKTPGIDATTGSLGQGASQAAGLALGLKNDGLSPYVYLFLGDGEINEGQVWEFALFAGHHKLNNLITFVDDNGKQLDGNTEDIIFLGDIAAKFNQFGWSTTTVDGSDVEQIYEAIVKAKTEKEKPSCIVLKTIKGKGIKEVEETLLNHHVTFSGELADKSIEILENRLMALEKEGLV